MISMGLDLSLTGTGVVVLNDGNMEMKEVIKSKKLGEKPSDEIARLRAIIVEIMERVDSVSPDMVAIEGMAFMAKGTSLVQLSGLNYMVRSQLVDRGIPFIIVAPTTLKKYATGAGNAGKDVVMLEIYKRWGVSILDNNAADAYALAQVGLGVTGNSKKTTKFQEEVISLIKTQL